MIDEQSAEEFRRAGDAAAEAVIAAYGLVGSRTAPITSHADRDAKLALLELLEVEIRVDGQRRMGAFLGIPRHLAGFTEDEIRELAESRLAKDKPLRRDIVEWREINRNVATAGAAALKVLCRASGFAQDLIDDPTPFVDKAEEKDPEYDLKARARIFSMAKAVMAYTIRHFKCDPTTAPRDLVGCEAWCAGKCNKNNPVPEWLQEHRGERTRFKLIKRRATDAFTGRANDEDDAPRERPSDDDDDRGQPRQERRDDE